MPAWSASASWPATRSEQTEICPLSIPSMEYSPFVQYAMNPLKRRDESDGTMKLQRLEMLILGLLIALVVGVYALLFRMVGDRLEQGNPERSVTLLQPEEGAVVQIGAGQTVRAQIVGEDINRLELWVNDIPHTFIARSLPAGNDIWTTEEEWAAAKSGWNQLMLRGVTTRGDVITSAPISAFAAPAGLMILFLSNREGRYALHTISSDGAQLQLWLAIEMDISGLAVSINNEVVVVKTALDGSSNIWLVDPSVGASAPLLDEGWNPHSPAWSWDGGYLAFVSDRSGRDQIWIMDVQGAGARQITDEPQAVADPCWSADNRFLAYSALRAGRWSIVVMELDSGVATRLTQGDANNWQPAWSPAGDQIAFVSDRTGYPQIYTMQPDGSEQRLITYLGGGAEQPAWSPDGQWLIFVGNDRNDPLGAHENARDLYLYCAEDGGWLRLTHTIYDDIRPAWWAPLPSPAP